MSERGRHTEEGGDSSEQLQHMRPLNLTLVLLVFAVNKTKYNIYLCVTCQRLNGMKHSSDSRGNINRVRINFKQRVSREGDENPHD